ncbi:MAG: transglutaminase-like domain-containing protein [Bacteroidota bacterium]|nr:transglutaminase-like domain-containing protein [Bacteroidota bacterium]
MPDERELYALFSLLDDPQPSVQVAVRDRLLAIGEEAVSVLRRLANIHNQNFERVEELVDEIRMTCTLRRLAASLENPSKETDLEEGVFVIARYGYPDVNVEAYTRRLTDMASDIRILAGARAAPIDRFMKMRSYLFSELGFMGNQHDYYNPDNSYFNKVIDYRRGIPITLSVLMLLVGSRLDLNLHGVGMPMHFLVQYDDGSRMFFVDPFNAGMIITQEQCKTLLSANGIAFTPSMLAPVGNNEILERMWRNLYISYQKTGNEAEVGRIARILQFIDPEFSVGFSPSPDEDDIEDEDDEE